MENVEWREIMLVLASACDEFAGRAEERAKTAEPAPSSIRE
jgi:hypothetical protein